EVFGLFFQAEDGIRDFHVTGVQTCALPISERGRITHDESLTTALHRAVRAGLASAAVDPHRLPDQPLERVGIGFVILTQVDRPRSEERRVGKECRSRSAPYDEKRNDKGLGK